MRSFTRRRTLLASALAVAATLAVAAPAMAASIAYVKDGDVWLSTGDGSRQVRVTSTGGYSDVSQADDGTMIALQGVRLHRLARSGAVLADFDTPVSDTRPAGQRQFFGPFDPAISPDGSKVAYTYYWNSQTQDQTCFPPRCLIALNEGGTGYSHSDRQTGWDEPGFARHSGWRNAAWADDDTTILSDPTHLPNFDVVVDRPAERAGATGFLAKNWFSDTADGNPHTSGGDISRDKRKLAFVTGGDDDSLTLYRVVTFPTAFPDGEADASERPQPCYRYGSPIGGHYGTPTFSPDGTRLAFAVGNGVHVVDVPDLSGGCTTDGASANSQLLIPGATQPDWGPADVPTGTAPAAITVRSVALQRALARGLKVSITGARAGRVVLRAKVQGRVVARRAATAGA